jgi:hypothetical protein
MATGIRRPFDPTQAVAGALGGGADGTGGEAMDFRRSEQQAG